MRRALALLLVASAARAQPSRRGDVDRRIPGNTPGPDMGEPVTPPPPAVHSRWTIAGAFADAATTLTPAIITRRFDQVYASAWQRCYAEAAKTYPATSYAVQLLVTIGESGRVVTAHAIGVPAELESCIESHAMNWHMPSPKDAAGDRTEIDVIALMNVSPE